MTDELDLLPVNKLETMDLSEISRIKPYLQTITKTLDIRVKYLSVGIAFLVLSLPFVNAGFEKLTGGPYGAFWLKLIIMGVVLTVLYKL